MKLIIRFSVMLITILLFNNAMAAENITGTWQGKLVVAPETELKIQFIISQDADGSYAVTLNSPEEGGIKNIKANSVAYDSGNLKLDVTDLSGTYEGVVKDGKIEGTWTQQGTSMPLSLTPYEKPTLSKEDKEKLLGSWNGPLEIPGGSLTIVFRFEMTEAGEFKGFADSPDQGGFGIPVSDMEMEDGTLTIKVSSLRAQYSGKIAGDEIVGEFKQGPQPIPLTLKRGEYKVKPINLDLPEEDKEKLLGPWHGELESPAGSRTVILRFETTEDGDFVGFAGSPGQGGSGIPVTDIEMEGGIVTIKVSSMRAEFKGKVAGDEIVGEFKQGPQSFPLTLKKGEYIEPVYSLDLTKETIELLLGKWEGKLNTPNVSLTVVFRFEMTEAGEFVGFHDSPDQGGTGVPITDANLKDDKLTLMMKRIGAEFNGQLSGSELAGEWKQGGRSFPVSFTKENL